MKPILLLFLATLPVMAAPQKGSTTKPAASPAPAAEPSNSQTAALDAAVRSRIEAFFKSLQEQRVKDGYVRLFEGATIVAEQPALLELRAKNTLLILEKCGKAESAQILTVRGAGRTLREVTCILNCQKQPVRWKFHVYFGEGRWQVLEANADLEVHSFFETEKSAAN